MNWLLKLFGILDKTNDRVEAAGERIATAAEDMAAEWEAARDQMRQRVGGKMVEPPVIEDRSEPARNGRKRVTA